MVGADDHVYPNHLDVMQWLADSNLLEMIVDKLSPSVSTIFESYLDPLGFAANDWNMGSMLSRATSDCFSLKCGSVGSSCFC